MYVYVYMCVCVLLCLVIYVHICVFCLLSPRSARTNIKLSLKKSMFSIAQSRRDRSSKRLPPKS